jgi:hypothetical protein
VSIDKRNDENTPTDTEDYETVASQEEIYLEETEEELRVMLTSDEIQFHYEQQPKVARSTTDANNNARTADGLDEELGHAVEELITSDSDDPPISEEAVVEMLRVSLNVRRLGPI